ncbi:hypothetical protein E6W39_30350 [Kitasatospora acidiphila]|uniref:Uncharacterized protein n=1 Tax=Kitasatospora acidiphila TaxID=2567942 RepID=A0A540W9R5_9ACTN|nr:hypothetical protein [Kitasatospora acidiphila]TQF05748.1 hypothetical protein E6W39_30350 [Kitasatospora acidiphila]
MLPSHSPVQLPGEADPDTLDALLDSSRRLGVFWPLLEGTAEPGSAPGGPITVPARTRELVAGMAEYGL